MFCFFQLRASKSPIELKMKKANKYKTIVPIAKITLVQRKFVKSESVQEAGVEPLKDDCTCLSVLWPLCMLPIITVKLFFFSVVWVK